MPTSSLRLKSALDWFTRLDGPTPFESWSSAFLHDLDKNPAYTVALAIRTVQTPYFENYDDTLRQLVVGQIEAECAQEHAFELGEDFTPFFVHAQVSHARELPRYVDVPNLLAQLSRVLGVPLDALRSDGEVYATLDISQPDSAWAVMSEFAWPLGEQASCACITPESPNTEITQPEGPLETSEVLIRCLVKGKHDSFLHEPLFDGLNSLPADDRPEHVRWQEGAQVTPCSVFQGPLEALMALNFEHPAAVAAHQVATATAHLAQSDTPPVVFTVDLAATPITFDQADLGIAFATETERALADLNDRMEACRSQDISTLEDLAEIRQSVVDSIYNLRFTINAFHGNRRFSRYEIDLPSMPVVACATLALKAADNEGALTLLSNDSGAETARVVIEELIASYQGDGAGASE